MTRTCRSTFQFPSLSAALLVAALVTLTSTGSVFVAAQDGGEDADVTRELSEIQSLLDGKRYQDALPLAKEAYEEYQRQYGSEAIETIEAADRLVICFRRLGQVQDEELALAQWTCDVRRKRYSGRREDLAGSLKTLGDIRFRRAEVSEAADAYRQAYAVLKEDHAGTKLFESVCNNLSVALSQIGKANEAIMYAEEVVRSRRISSPGSPLLVKTMASLAHRYLEMARDGEAEALLSEAVQLAEEVRDEDPVRYATTLKDYASYFVRTDRNVEAELWMRRSLEAYRTVPSLDPLLLTVPLHVMGGALASLGQFDRAIDAKLEALDIIHEAEEANPNLNLETALRVRGEIELSIGEIFLRNGRYEEALPYFRSAYTHHYAYYEAHDLVAGAIHNLAIACAETGRRAEADSLYQVAVSMRRGTPGSSPSPRLQQTLGAYAFFLTGEGRLDDAELLFEEALETFESSDLSPESPEFWGPYLVGTGALRDRQGRYGKALEIATELETRRQGLITSTSERLSDHELILSQPTLRGGLGLAVSLVLERPEAESHVEQIWGLAIKSRGIVFDEMARRRATANSLHEQGKLSVVSNLNRARQRLANLTMRGADEETLERAQTEVRARLDEFAEAAAGISLFASPHDPRLAPEALREEIPRDAVLVGYLEYSHWDLGDHGAPATNEPTGNNPFDRELRYCAFVARRDEPVEIVPLGEAGLIDGAVAAWLEVVTGRSDMAVVLSGKDGSKEGRTLRRLIWDPLQSYVGEAELALLVPDGTLCGVSFSALPTEEGPYLIETGPSFHYLSSERELRPRRLLAPTGESLLLVGNVDYDATPPKIDSSHEPVPPHFSELRSPPSSCEDFLFMRFEPLQHAKEEIEFVRNVFTSSRAPETGIVLTLTGEEATESAVKGGMRERRLIHLATHGFYLPPACELQSAEPSLRATSWSIAENPLLRSGVALAAVNGRASIQSQEDSSDDGILTAEEVSCLDLSGTELVVLSTCESGLGTQYAGEGALGIRRAFGIAGARSVIASLWPVDDAAGAAWVQTFYRSYLEQGLDVCRAARLASIQVLRERRDAGLDEDPFTWAAFVSTGDWRRDPRFID